MDLWQLHADIVGNASISTSYSKATTFKVNDTFLNSNCSNIIDDVAGVIGISIVMRIIKRR